VVNAVTKSELSSGKSFLINTELTQQALIMVTLIFNLKESMFITMKPLEEDMFQEPSLWILNQEPWTLLELDLSDNFSDLIISSLDKQEPETTGQKDITLKELNLLTQSLMLPENKPKDVIAFKVSKLLTHWEEEQDQEWELSLSQKSDKNIPTELWKLSQLSPHQKFQIQSLNPTTPLYLSINWSKTLINAWLLTMKPSMISVSEPLSSPPQLMVILTI
jgi:hypothetical protein